MRILQISNYYKPHTGGIEQVAHDISDSLSNITQKVICFSEDNNTKYEVIDGVEVVKCGVIKKISSQAISLTYKKELIKIMNEFNPDIVIFHYPNPFVSHFLLKYLKKKTFKFVLYWHLDITKQKILKLFFNGQNKKLLKYADKIVCTSPIYRDSSEYLPYYKNKVEVIPCCINEERLETTDEHKNIANKIKEENVGKTIIFALGRHVPYKGLKYLVEASKYLSEDFKIFIGGVGPLTDELKKQAICDDKIVFLGKVSDDDLKGYLLAMDIYAFPSITKNEAFGISLAEAMYFAHPAVTFHVDGSGVNYVSLNGITGIEVENSNAKLFADALEKLKLDDELRKKLGDKARERVINNFTFKQFSDNINKLIGDLQ